jgi:hypothetical protein
MNTDFTPNKLIDNLNKNFDNIINEALIGYYKFWKMEQQIIALIRERNLQLQNDEELSHMLALAKCIQYGKSFFYGEVQTNFRQMKQINTYIELVKPYLSQQKKSSVSIEQLPDEIQTGGMSPFLKAFFSLVAGLVINSCDNATAFANTIASPSQDVMVYSIAGGETGETFPRAKPTFTQQLDPLNETQMEEFATQFGTYFFPEEKNLELNINEIYKSRFIKDITKDVFFKFWLDEDKLREEFSDMVSYNVKELNIMLASIHISLEDMCRKFVDTRDPILPIRLFQLFNDEYGENLEKLQKLQSEEEENIRSELKSQKLAELEITTPEPGLITSISEYFSFNRGSKSEGKSNKLLTASSLSASELKQVYIQIEDDTEKEIQQMAPEFHKKANEKVFSEAITKFTRETEMKTDLTNLEVYFSRICYIKKTHFTYDKKTGLLYIVNSVRSRYHLTILSKNVISYYERVIGGLKSVDERTGEIISDIPDEERLRNLKSLYEKAKVILPIMTKYDERIAHNLAEGTMYADNITEFFKVISKMWEDLKEPIKEAILDLPLTAKKEEIARTRSKEEFKSLMKDKLQQGSQTLELWRTELEQKASENKLTETETSLWKNYVGLKVSGTLDPFEIAVSSFIDTTGNIVVNAEENIGRVIDRGTNIVVEQFDKGSSTIIRNVYSIAAAGMTLFVSIAIGAGLIGYGPVGVVFKSVAERMGSSQKKPRVRRPRVIGPPILELEPVNAPIADDDEENYNRFKSQKEEGEEYNPRKKYGGKKRKTRKNRKHKTRKLKIGKKRQTKRRRMRSIKRH